MTIKKTILTHIDTVYHSLRLRPGDDVTIEYVILDPVYNRETQLYWNTTSSPGSQSPGPSTSMDT